MKVSCTIRAGPGLLALPRLFVPVGEDYLARSRILDFVHARKALFIQGARSSRGTVWQDDLVRLARHGLTGFVQQLDLDPVLLLLLLGRARGSGSRSRRGMMRLQLHRSVFSLLRLYLLGFHLGGLARIGLVGIVRRVRIRGGYHTAGRS